MYHGLKETNCNNFHKAGVNQVLYWTLGVVKRIGGEALLRMKLIKRMSAP